MRKLNNEEAVLSLVDVNFNEYHLPSLFAYLDYNSLGYALVTNKYFYDFYDRRTGQVATSDEFEF